MAFLPAAVSFDVSKAQDGQDFLGHLLAAFAVFKFVHVPVSSHHGFLIPRDPKTVAFIDVIYGIASAPCHEAGHQTCSTAESKYHRAPVVTKEC
jgi:hypothetical protein